LIPLLAAAAAMAAVHPPVVLVHGIDDTSQKMAALDRYLGARGWPSRVRFDMVPADGARSLTELSAQVERQVSALLAATRAPQVDLVAFSMGTVISRHYLQRRGGMERTRRFVAISGPHGGTLTGFFRWNPGATEMRPGSAFLKDLDRDVAIMAQRVRCYSIFSPFDLMILPFASSRVPWARNTTIPVLIHPWMVEDGRVLEAVAKNLSEE